MTWKKAKLKDLGWLRSAGVNKLSEPNQKEVRLLNYMDIYRNQKISNDIDFQVVTAKDAEIKNANLEVGDILFTPSSEKPTDIGHAGIIIEELENTVYSYHLVRFRPDEPKKFNPHFLAYALNSFSSEKHFISRATGTTRYTLSKSDFQSLEFEYPENPTEQTAIATLLSKVDEAIAATQNSIKAAEKLKKALMQNLLTGKLKPDGSWRTEDEFYETKIGRIPNEWKLLNTKDFCEKVTDGTHDTPKPNNTGFPLVTSKNLKVNGVDFNDCYLISEQDYKEINKRSKVEQYDILFGMIGTVGNPQIVMQNPVEFAIKNVGLFRMNGNAKLSLWLKNYLASDIFRIYQQRQQAGTTQQFVSLGFLRKIPVPIPMVDNEINYLVIDGINKKIEIADSELISKQTKTQTLQRLKKSLMQNLLTGKVRLPQEFIEQCEEAVEEVNKTVTAQ